MLLHALRSSALPHLGTRVVLFLAIWPAAFRCVQGLDAQAPATARANAPATAPGLTPELERVRSALDKYRDPIRAVHDGYFSSVGCIEYAPSRAAGANPSEGAGYAP